MLDNLHKDASRAVNLCSTLGGEVKNFTLVSALLGGGEKILSPPLVEHWGGENFFDTLTQIYTQRLCRASKFENIRTLSLHIIKGD